MSLARLHANESVWGPSPTVARALAGSCTALYPERSDLERLLGASLGVDGRRIVLENGSTALIGLLVQTFCRPDQAVATTDGTFVAYRQLAEAAGRRVQLARPRPRGGVDLDALSAVIDRSTALVFIANPDNPSGTLCSSDALDRFLDTLPTPGPLVVLDEAYREFVRRPTYPCATRYLDDPRVVVLRTFSKAFGLAGLRCGFLAGSEPVTRRLQQIGGPYRVGLPTRAAAQAAWLDRAYLEDVVDRTIAERRRLEVGLESLGFGLVESHTNFVMLHVDIPAEHLAGQLQASGLQVRSLDRFGWSNALRLTVGQPAQTDWLLTELGRLA